MQHRFRFKNQQQNNETITDRWHFKLVDLIKHVKGFFLQKKKKKKKRLNQFGPRLTVQCVVATVLRFRCCVVHHTNSVQQLRVLPIRIKDKYSIEKSCETSTYFCGGGFFPADHFDR